MPFKMFIHGLDSSNLGTKSVFFKEKYPDIVIPNFRGDLKDRMEKLHRLLSDESDIRLIGSSFGGLMAVLFALENGSKVNRLVLLAPAIHVMGHRDGDVRQITVPVWVYHGKSDEVIPLKEVEMVSKGLFTDLSFHSVEDDHALHKTFKTIDWDGFLLS